MKGISWEKNKRKWKVSIYLKATKDSKHIGYFNDYEEAIYAYNEASLLYDDKKPITKGTLYYGVIESEKWIVYIFLNRKMIRLGEYDSLENAKQIFNLRFREEYGIDPPSWDSNACYFMHGKYKYPLEVKHNGKEMFLGYFENESMRNERLIIY